MHLSHISICGAAVIILIKCAWKAIVPVLTRAAVHNASSLLRKGVQVPLRICGGWKPLSVMASTLPDHSLFFGIYLIASKEWVSVQKEYSYSCSCRWLLWGTVGTPGSAGKGRGGRVSERAQRGWDFRCSHLRANEGQFQPCLPEVRPKKKRNTKKNHTPTQAE